MARHPGSGAVFEAAHLTIQDAVSDSISYAVLVGLLHRHYLPAEMRYDLAFEPKGAGSGPGVLLLVARAAEARGISPSAVVERAVADLAAALRADSAIDRRWAKKVLALVDRPWVI